MTLKPFQKAILRDLRDGVTFGTPEPLVVKHDPISGTVDISGGSSMIHEPSINVSYDVSGGVCDLRWGPSWMPTREDFGSSRRPIYVETSPYGDRT